MKSEFPIFLAAALLLGSSGAEAAQTNNNIILAPPPPISSTPPQTNPIGGVNTGQSFGALPGIPQTNPNEGVGSLQNFGALPGEPGSPTYNPNAALPPADGQKKRPQGEARPEAVRVVRNPTSSSQSTSWPCRPTCRQPYRN